ncbi:MAG: 50S ribosomal protein L23 [Puniceicoccales bacterium]|jgi:large subunit ribosomal protein L23|nr:50S ribosomal protein L23 [Puniceicoccales bacterium]
MKPAYSVIKKPIITEKTSTLQGELNKYTFEIAQDADRRQVAAAVAAQFKVKVARVNILVAKGKIKESRQQRGLIIRKPDVKKAVVTLEKGSKIEFV